MTPDTDRKYTWWFTSELFVALGTVFAVLVEALLTVLVVKLVNTGVLQIWMLPWMIIALILTWWYLRRAWTPD